MATEQNNLMSDLDYEIFDIIEKAKRIEGYPIKQGVIEIKKAFEKRIDSLKEQLDSKNDTMMMSSLNWLKEMLK